MIGTCCSQAFELLWIELRCATISMKKTTRSSVSSKETSGGQWRPVAAGHENGLGRWSFMGAFGLKMIEWNTMFEFTPMIEMNNPND